MEWVGGADTVAQFDAFLLGLLLLRRGLGVGAAHRSHYLLIGVSGWDCVRFRWHLAKQASLDNAQNFVALDWLAALVLPRGEMVNCLQQIYVVERFALGGLQGKDKHAVRRVA